MPPLSILIWLPAACGLIGALLPGGGRHRATTGEPAAQDDIDRRRRAPGLLALLGGAAALGLAIAYLVDYSPGSQGLKDVTDVVWISSLGIHYKLGVSGLNVVLVAMTALLFFAALLAANLRDWKGDGETAPRAVSGAGRPARHRLFYFYMALAESAVLGAFLAQDLALFVAFFDLMLIPFYFLILIGDPDLPSEYRVKATIKLVIYTLVGSLLMLAAAVATGVLAAQQNGGHVTFVLSQLHALPLSNGSQDWIFLFFAAAFLVKMPAFPLHGWLPDGYRAMPSEVLMVFSGVLSKVGAYGFLAIALPLFPHAAAHFQLLLLVLGLCSILYGSAMAFSQNDARLVAGYSSVAQLGFITLGIFALNPQGAQGALLQMVNHGLVVAPIFFIISLLAARAGGSRDIREMGGIAFRAPVLAAVFLIVALATLAMPGSGNFVGEFLILLGVFKAKLVVAIVAFAGVVAASVYALRLFIRAMHNRVGERVDSREMSWRDGLVLVPLVAVILLLALYPQGALKRSERSAEASVAAAHTALSAPPTSVAASEPSATNGESAAEGQAGAGESSSEGGGGERGASQSGTVGTGGER